MKKYLLLLNVSLISCFSYSQNDEVLLSVGDDKIILNEFKLIFFKNNHNDSIITKDYLDEYMQLFINFRLKVKEARALGYDTVTAFKNELNMYRKQLAKPYLSDNQFDDKLLEEAYNRMKKDINASHILFKVNEEALDSDTIKAYESAISVRNKILKGMNFEDAAESFSDDKSAINNRGNLGYFTVFMMVYPFESVAYETAIGKISMPVRTKYGYHLIKVNDIRDAVGEVHVAHIMIKTPKEITAEDLNIAKTKINDIYEKLKDGENFGELANKFSEDKTTALKGGKISWFGVGKMVKEFENISFLLQSPNDISKPFRTNFGWHIIKLLDKRSIPSFDKVKNELKKRIKQDSRNELLDKAVISKIKKEYNFKQYTSRLNELLKYVDESLSSEKWDPSNTSTFKRNLFVLDDNYFTQADFVKYIKENHIQVKDNYQVYFNKLFKAFVDKTCLDYENSRLEKKYPEFSALFQEYTDGILLFDVMNDKVWSKAVKDTLGLETYFEFNKNNYMWGERIEANIYTCIDEKIAIKTRWQIKKRHRMPYLKNEDVLKKINYSSPLNLQIAGKKYSKGENEYIDKSWKVGTTENIKGKDGSIVIVDVLEIIPDENKELFEVKGKVISDYQDFLEKQWITQLKRKYNVVVNYTVLYSLLQ